MGFELFKRSHPASLVTAPTFFIVQLRVRESNFRAFGHRTQRDLDA